MKQRLDPKAFGATMGEPVPLRRVFIAGVGMTKIGEHWDKDLSDLVLEAVVEASVLSGIERLEVDSFHYGSALSQLYSRQGNTAALVADRLGLSKMGIPLYEHGGGSAAGALALRAAWLDVASGLADLSVAAAADKMTDLKEVEHLANAGLEMDSEWEASFGLTPHAAAGLVADAYIQKYGLTREALSLIPSLFHSHAALNEKAQYQKAISPEAVSKSLPVALPLRMFDCAPVSDGAAAVFLASEDFVKYMTEKIPDSTILHYPPLELVVVAPASQKFNLAYRSDITKDWATLEAGRKSFEACGATVDEVNVVEVHDDYSIYALTALEALGFAPFGMSWKGFQKGLFTIESASKGEGPAVNTSGGRKAQGAPRSAIGLTQVYEVALQLWGLAGKRQVKNAKVGLCQTKSASSALAVVSILRSYPQVKWPVKEHSITKLKPQNEPVQPKGTDNEKKSRQETASLPGKESPDNKKKKEGGEN
ncbi:MAG: thiolase domain-containing protein [Thermoplasmata archaeon]